MAFGRHLGDLILDSFKSLPDAVHQIDAATGQSETNASVMKRSVRLAGVLRTLGLKPGDVLALGGRNHLDLCIPYYAALLNGLPILGADPLYKFDEIKSLLSTVSPKIVFCDVDLYQTYIRAVEELRLETKVYTIGDRDSDLGKLLEQNSSDGAEEYCFEPSRFDLDTTYIFLMATSGTTGKSKLAAFHHRVWLDKVTDYLAVNRTPNGEIPKPGINFSPIQWISAIWNFLIMPLHGRCLVQSSLPMGGEHAADIINKYKPEFAMAGPAMFSRILNSGKKCNFSSFRLIIVGGGNPNSDLVSELKKRAGERTKVSVMYGLTENLGAIMAPDPLTQEGSCGRPNPKFRVKLMDPVKGIEVSEPYKTGELWTLGPRFACYYNNPEETARAFSDDGWFKTGDLMYRNESNDYFFVERLKALIKYQSYHVIPSELEEVIRSHPSVQEVAVTSVPHRVDGEHPVACVVRKTGAEISAQEVMDLVASKLSEKKQLHGGVVFLDTLPLTSSGKLSIAKLKETALNAHREI